MVKKGVVVDIETDKHSYTWLPLLFWGLIVMLTVFSFVYFVEMLRVAGAFLALIIVVLTIISRGV